jgi:S-adenosylmethionine hydrolase
MNATLITLTTDFGERDPFVGMMKGAIFGIHPDARVVDLTHGIPSQDIMAAALVLQHSAPYFPRGTIHVVVVDPGVGSARRAILIEREGDYLVGPDNGVLSLALEEKKPRRVVHLSNAVYHLQPTSSTFHGRDIFAPVAAHLARGVSPDSFGESLNSFVQIPWPKVAKSARAIEGEIVYIDHFGNLFTNIREADLNEMPAQKLTVSAGRVVIQGVTQSYGASEAGQWVAVINSWGLLEIAINRGSAHHRLQAQRGDRITVAVSER